MTALNSLMKFGLICSCLVWCGVVVAQDSNANLAKQFDDEVRPLLKKYCFECHAGEVKEAEIDLASMKSLAEVRRHTGVWIKVRRMLSSRQMPPKDAAQLSEGEQAVLQTWVHDFLRQQAAANAGDPGAVVLRRLTNAEYNYTIADLTGINSLDPTAQFPVDGAAGEGFTNSGSAQGMSPALVQKYLDAAKDVAQHVVLLPHGIRFSPHISERDRTDQLLAEIQAFYRRFTNDAGGTSVNLQGIKFETNQGGRLPLKDYLAATLEIRDHETSIAQVAATRGLNEKYLQLIWQGFSNPDTALLSDIAKRWRSAKSADELVLEITEWQDALWKFNVVGQMYRDGGPKSWLESVSPIAAASEVVHSFRENANDADPILYLVSNSLGKQDGKTSVVWKNPRLIFSDGRAAISLHDVRELASRVDPTVARELPRTAEYLNAVSSRTNPDDLNPVLLESWKRLVGIDNQVDLVVSGHLATKSTAVQGYPDVNGWSGENALSVLTNRSSKPISFLTLTVPARGVTVHPSPEKEAVIAWQCPIDGVIRTEGSVEDADRVCGNGAAWRIQHTSSSATKFLADGVFDNGGKAAFKVDQDIAVRRGDIVALVVNSRDKSHACDTTHLTWKLSEVDGKGRVWELSQEVVDRILDSNPLSDSFGNEKTWHFCDTASFGEAESIVPTESALARWRAAVLESKPTDEIKRLAAGVQRVLITKHTSELSNANLQLRQMVHRWTGPIDWIAASENAPAGPAVDYGIATSMFGNSSNSSVGNSDLYRPVSEALEVRLPAGLVAGAKLTATCVLANEDGSAQAKIETSRQNASQLSPSLPILVGNKPKTRTTVESAMKGVRELFPPVLCYSQIVPVDEVVTLILFYREDDHLKRLMLNEQQVAELDRLWDELFYISKEPIKLTVAHEQIYEFATQDRPDLVTAFDPVRKPLKDRAEAFKRRVLDSQPSHLDDVLSFADRAWRRSLTEPERDGLRNLYQQLRQSELSHERAIRLTLARVLTSPAFLYKLESPQPNGRQLVREHELAGRLSFFLWSSIPDDELRATARQGHLRREIVSQTERMLADSKTRRLAIQFACQWLHLRDFDQNDDKNEKLYPEFATLRRDMYEETVRFFEEMFRKDGSILDLLDADFTFVNKSLAKHYGVPESRLGRDQGQVGGVDEWVRVEGIRPRGGVLGMASFLASQSGASRTSPILRGNWVYETLLGERLPRPPANVPQLPDTLPGGLTARQLIEQHSSVAACAKCHERIDPFGFALEQYDAIGRLRPRTVDTRTRLHNGGTIEGLDGLREYLVGERRNDVVRQFCRKLLGFSLGREVMLSDEPLLDKMASELIANDYRFSVAARTIVQSDQFQTIRGTNEATHD